MPLCGRLPPGLARYTVLPTGSPPPPPPKGPDDAVAAGDTWGMRFNAGKCHIMQEHRGQPLVHFHSLCGKVVSPVKEAKYLGVQLGSDLGWSPHVATTAGKASSALGFFKRNLKQCPATLREPAYIAYIHSILEYASPTLWSLLCWFMFKFV